MTKNLSLPRSCIVRGSHGYLEEFLVIREEANKRDESTNSIAQLQH